jgi:hypothetical protein
MKTIKNMFPNRTHKGILPVFLGLFLLQTATLVSANPDEELSGNVEGIVFESSIPEPALMVEDWMTAPFENSFAESDLIVEDWMSTPFENTYTESELMVEDWMTAPFENSFTESELIVEDWMTSPF